MLKFALASLLPLILSYPLEGDSGSSTSDSTLDEATYNFSPNTTAWSTDANDKYLVWGSSCNTTQLELIGQGLDQTLQLVSHARAHVRRYGVDDYFTRWFGSNASSNQIEGLFDKLVDGDKHNVSFTCDDVDSTCNGKYGVIPGYFSSSVPDLTIVCPTFYLSKAPLDELCTGGKTIASQGSESTDGSWFLHRLLHLPAATGGGLSDVVDSAHDAAELAKGVNASQAIDNIHTIQYYALDVYASDILLPGQGCLGDLSQEVASDD